MTLPEDYLDIENWETMYCPVCQKAYSVSKYSSKICSECGGRFLEGEAERIETVDFHEKYKFLDLSGNEYIYYVPIMMTTGVVE